MIQDPTDEYIRQIVAAYDPGGRDVLEIGCGSGRITRDLARHARRVVATDPDPGALAAARRAIAAPNVEFREVSAGGLELPERFDLAIYTLSLHHVPRDEMQESLVRCAGLLRPGGGILVLEPGDGGSLTEAKERFGAGSGDEREGKEAAIRAMHALKGWEVGSTVRFRTLFQYASEEEFLERMLPGFSERPLPFREEVSAFLARHRTPRGVVLDAERRLNLLLRRPP